MMTLNQVQRDSQVQKDPVAFSQKKVTTIDLARRSWQFNRFSLEIRSLFLIGLFIFGSPLGCSREPQQEVDPSTFVTLSSQNASAPSPEPSRIQKITGTEAFNKFISQKGIVVVDYSSDHCPPCRMLLPHLEALAKNQANKLQVGLVKTNEERTISYVQGIQVTPTIQIYYNGRLRHLLTGYLSEKELLSSIRRAVPEFDSILITPDNTSQIAQTAPTDTTAPTTDTSLTNVAPSKKDHPSSAQISGNAAVPVVTEQTPSPAVSH